MLDNGPHLSPWDVLSLGTFCPWDVLSLGRFVPWDVLSLGRFVPWNVLSLGRLVLGRFVLGRFVCASLTYVIFKCWEILYCTVLFHLSLPLTHILARVPVRTR